MPSETTDWCWSDRLGPVRNRQFSLGLRRFSRLLTQTGPCTVCSPVETIAQPHQPSPTHINHRSAVSTVAHPYKPSLNHTIRCSPVSTVADDITSPSSMRAGGRWVCLGVPTNSHYEPSHRPPQPRTPDSRSRARTAPSALATGRPSSPVALRTIPKPSSAPPKPWYVCFTSSSSRASFPDPSSAIPGGHVLANLNPPRISISLWAAAEIGSAITGVPTPTSITAPPGRVAKFAVCAQASAPVQVVDDVDAVRSRGLREDVGSGGLRQREFVVADD